MKSLRVLFVEDNETISELTCDVLLYAVPTLDITIARSEADAIRCLTTEKYDVAIVDVMIKDGNGIDVLRKSKAHKSGYWIVFSNHSRQNVRDMAKDSGADELLDKSNDLDSLIRILVKLAKD